MHHDYLILQVKCLSVHFKTRIYYLYIKCISYIPPISFIQNIHAYLSLSIPPACGSSIKSIDSNSYWLPLGCMVMFKAL